MDGPLTRAVREGAIFYLDEVVEARQDTTVVIHPLADHRRELPVDRLGTTLPAAPGFQLVISYNPGYQSVLKNLKESTRQRFIAIELDFPSRRRRDRGGGPRSRDRPRDRGRAGEARQRHPKPGWLTVARSVLHPMLILAGGLVAEGLHLRSAVAGGDRRGALRRCRRRPRPR